MKTDKAGPLWSGAVPGFITGDGAYRWYKRYGPDAKWADFSCQDPEYEQAVESVAHLQGVRFRRFEILTHVGNVPPPSVYCRVIANDPVAALPSFVSQRWPSLDAALEHAGWHSRTEDGVSVQVAVDYVDR